MINAKEEILDHIRGKDVEFLRVAYIERYGEKGLRIDGELNDCVKLLDFYTMMVLAVKNCLGLFCIKMVRGLSEKSMTDQSGGCTGSRRQSIPSWIF